VADLEAANPADLALTGGGSREPSPPAPVAGDEAVMSLVDHLAELRRRLAISILAIVLGSVLGLFLAPRAIEILKAPIPGALRFTDLGGAFFIQLKVAVVIGVVLAMPVILWQLWRFIAPGLTPEERRLARPWVPLALVFFALGVAVAYVVLPFASAFLLGFAVPGVLEPLITAEAYFGFVTMLFLAFGLVMEFPIVLVLLGKVGIVSSERLRKNRRMIILGITIFAVVVTPGGDPISPTVLGVVMYLLFEFSIRLVRWTGR
jgi:sec-independent protein translocase protein TatC